MSDRRPLTIGFEFITVEVSDEERRIIDQWVVDHHASLDEALDGTDLTAEDIMLPTWRRMVYEDDDEVIQAAIDSGLARSTAPSHTDGGE